MKKILRAAAQTLFATLLLLVCLEGAFYFLGFPPGGSAFLEAIVMREKLSTKKPEGEFRIFTYGESTMHGAHYWPLSSPSRWLNVYLKDFLPGKKIRVVNFGRLGKGSEFHYEVFRDSVAYQPDTAIFYSGHNAFLPGNRKEEVEADRRQKKRMLREMLRQSRFFSAVYRRIVQIRDQYKSKLPEEEMIEYRSIETMPPGPALARDMFLRSSPRYWENIKFQKENIVKILDLAQKKGIRTLFFKPVSNLKDFAPTHSAHQTHLSEDRLVNWKKLYARGRKAEKQRDFSNALKFYNKAYLIDPTYAHLCFRMGKIYFAQGELETAKRLFQEARDYDTIIVRATSDAIAMFDELKEEKKLEFIDTEKIVVAEAPGGILGEPVIEDNVHFSLKGHALVGRAMAEEIADRNWIAPRAEWRFQRARPYEEILKEFGVGKELLFSAFIKTASYFGSRYDNRIRYAQKALEIYPDDARALRHLAWAYWLKGDKENALAVYRRLGEVHPEVLQFVLKTLPELKLAFKKLDA